MSANTMQKAQLRKGDFHLRTDHRQLYGNYVELSPHGGAVGFERNRRATMVVDTPVFDEPRMWEIDLQFSAPRGVLPGPLIPPSGPTPWVPGGFNFDVNVTVTAALDRDKVVSTQNFTLRPLGFGEPNRLPIRFQNAHQLSISVSLGDPGAGAAGDQVLGVQGSAWPVDTSTRDAFGNAVQANFLQSAVSAVFLTPNALRRQFFVQNWGDTPLYLAFDSLADATTSSFTFALPNHGDVYESPRDCWQGYVAGVWDADALLPNVALVTELT
jgi:hypothetical protein